VRIVYLTGVVPVDDGGPPDDLVGVALAPRSTGVPGKRGAVVATALALPRLLMGCSIAAHAAAPQSSPDYNCWHMSPLDPTRYELIIKLSSAVAPQNRTGARHAEKGCYRRLRSGRRTRRCLPGDISPSDGFRHSGSQKPTVDGREEPGWAAVFDYVIPNAPVHLVENTIVASQPRPGHITLPDIPTARWLRP